MIANILTTALRGIEAVKVDIEVDINRGLPAFNIVGLADRSVDEAKERVRSAIKHINLKFPMDRVTVNLSPADLQKSGSGFDLGIALAVLVASEQVLPDKAKDYVVVGELGLNGDLRGVKGVVSSALYCKKFQKKLIVPKDNYLECRQILHQDVAYALNLEEVAAFFNGAKSLHRDDLKKVDKTLDYPIDFSDIKGAHQAKRALEIVAAGGHNLLFYGPPGSGKTMLAQALPSILPELVEEEYLQVMQIASVVGELSDELIAGHRPFRAPHHTASYIAIVGGGSNPKPGEVSLAHGGVLFLDELAEFPRQVLESLRQPLENGSITITRSAGNLELPARFILIGSTNPCPCGYFGDKKVSCKCTGAQIQNYQKKLSGPLLDRIDLHVEVPRQDYDKLTAQGSAESKSTQAKARVSQAREIQAQRFLKSKNLTNSTLSAKQIEQFCILDKESDELARSAMTSFNLSARAFHRLLKVARTIADLDGAENIKVAHLAEGLSYRPKEY